MNNKRIQANMQLNVSFLAKPEQLIKQMASISKQINLNSAFGKPVTDALTKGFKDALDTVNKMSQGLSKKGLNPKEYTQLFNELNNKLEESLNFTRELKKTLTDAFKSTENKQGLKDLEKYRDILKQINEIGTKQKGSSTRKQSRINQLQEESGLDYNNATTRGKLKNLSDRFSAGIGLTKQQQRWAEELKFSQEDLKEIVKLYDKIEKHAQKIAEYNTQASKLTGEGSVEKSRKKIEGEIGKLEKSVINEESYKNALKLGAEIENLGKVFPTSEQRLTSFNTSLEEGQIRAEQMAAASATLREVLGQFGITLGVGQLARSFRDLMKYSFEFYRSLDSALNQIYVVSSLSSEKVNSLKSNFINMAKETGMSIDDVTRSAVLFYQQGLNTDQVMTMTEVTSQFAKVAGIDAADAADKLTAAVNGYCLAAEDAVSVADKFNKVAAASAADINELSTAFSKAAAQANQAGVSMDNYLAYIATMEEATREAPENIGTSLKTIFSRMQQIKTGENTEDSTDVNQVETALRSVNIALRDANGQLRDLEEIFAELGPKWNQLDRNTQAYIGTIVAGTRQQSRFITLMQNWDRVLDLASQSENSAGQQALMHAKAMDSIESKLQQLTVAWQEFISNLGSSDLFKTLISGLTSVIKLFNEGTKPMSIFASIIGLIALKTNDLTSTLNKTVKDKFKSFGQFFNFTTKEAKNKQMLAYSTELQNMPSTQSLWNKIDTSTGAEKIAAEEELTRITERRKQIQQEINNLNQKEVIDKKEAIQRIGVAIGTALNTAGIAIANVDQNLGGVVGSMGTMATFATQIATGNWVGAIATGVTLFIQLKDLIENFDDRVKERIDNAVNDISDALNKVNNVTTQINNTQKLIDRYDVLIGTIYRTQEEQEELNRIVQELGDTNNVDVLTDAYGNLTINITEVETELKKLRKEQEETLKELKEQERESLIKGTTGLGNNTTMEEFMKKNLLQNRGDYNSLLSGLTSTLINAAGEEGKQAAQAFSSNLKTELRHQIELNPLKYSSPSEAMLTMQEDINEALGSNTDAFKDLNSMIDFLKQNIDNMTYAQAQDRLQRYWETWHDELKLTEDEWEIFKSTINTTVFQNSNIVHYIEEANQLTKEMQSGYYDEQIAEIQKYLKTVEGFRASSWDWLNPLPAIGPITAGMKTSTRLLEALWEATDETGKEVSQNYKIQKQQLEELIAKRDKYLETYATEHNLVDKEGNPLIEEARLEIEARQKLADSFTNMTNENQAFFNNIKSLFDFSNLEGIDKVNMANFIDTVSRDLGQVADGSDADRFNVLALTWEKNKDKFSVELQAKMQDVLDAAYKNLKVPTPKNLKQIGESLKSFGEDLVDLNSLISKFNSQGGLMIDEFIELGGIIDSIDFSKIGALDPSLIDTYISAIKELNLAYDENSGVITANGESLQALQKIQQIQTETKIANLIADLQASRATTETQLAYIDAQIAATDNAIRMAQMDKDNTLDVNELKLQANDVFATNFDTMMENIVGDYENDIRGQGKWSKAILLNIATVAEAWGKYFQGVKDQSTTTLKSIRETAKNIVTEQEIGWEGNENGSGIDWSQFDSVIQKGSKQQEELLNKLNEYRNSLVNTKTEYQAILDKTNSEINFLQSLQGKDLSKLGLSASESAEKLSQYIGKLKEIFNILNRIEVLEHRLSMLDSYADIEEEKEYGDHLKERIGINKELLSQYDFLVREQKAWTNGYKDFIEESAVADVFDFDKFGQIIIDFEKYNALQTEAVSGQKSLKEQADDLYDTYTSMYKELQQDADNYIKTLKAAIDYQRQVYDAYVDTEHDIADAIKEIYQKILDTKLDAIDQEKDALDELQKERDRARKDQENAKAVTGLQTNLQRAMMDTSGASDTAFIKAQNDINNKLEQIADDKYSQMLNDIKDKLDEEKEALQQEFDEMFDDLSWLFDWMETSLMNDQDGIVAILQQTSDWRQDTEAEHAEDIDRWNTRFETYRALITGEDGSTIMDVVHSIDELQRKTIEIDETLKNDVSKRGAEIITAIQNGLAGVQAAVGSGGGSGGGTTNSSYTSTSNTNTKQPSDVNVSDVTRQTVAHPVYNGGLNSMVGKVVELDKNTTYQTYGTMRGDNPGTYKSNSLYEENVTVLTAPTWSDEVGAYLVKINGSNIGTKFVKASADRQGVGSTKYFHDRGWFKSGTKYATGGLANYTGLAWLDGTPQHPEYVLNALQTEHFMKLTNILDKMYSQPNGGGMANNVVIDNISFNVASMSSPEDGEAAFNMFVNKFKEIGSQTGLKINTFKNTL